MRKSREETAETRQRIVEVASIEFRRNGIEKTGLSDVMAAAGMTHGGFYKHFESKEQIVSESLAHSIERMISAWEKTLSDSDSERGLQKAVAQYVSPGHRDDIAHGCPFLALGGDTARSSEQIRETATAGFVKMVDLITDHLSGSPRSVARKQALWILAGMVGAVTTARLVNDPGLSDSILREARKQLASAIEEHSLTR